MSEAQDKLERLVIAYNRIIDDRDALRAERDRLREALEAIVHYDAADDASGYETVSRLTDIAFSALMSSLQPDAAVSARSPDRR